MTDLVLFDTTLPARINTDDDVTTISQLLYSVGAEFIQYKDSPLLTRTKNFNQLQGKIPSVLFVSDNMLDILNDDQVKVIEQYLNCTVKFTSTLIS